jgi:hypothetical protein
MLRRVRSFGSTPNCSIVTSRLTPVASRTRSMRSRTVRGLPTITVPLAINSSMVMRPRVPRCLRIAIVRLSEAIDM